MNIKMKAIRKDERWAEYARFGATGLLNTAVDFTVLNLLILSLGPDIQARALAVLKAAAFCAAVANSYLLNRYWVFRHAQSHLRDKGSHVGLGGKFLAVSVAGFFINVAASTAIFYLLADRLGLVSPHSAANIGAALGTLFTLVSNYAGYKAFVFKKTTSYESHKEHPALGGDTGLQRIQANTSDAR
ncbi:MAG: GtrA family protein [Candidatus Taylorbacteria bacterium]|nr:GtrA family protein [Candidatus Taylorbacteria bacterium]